MDYEFRRNLYGHYQAEFSMGHEAFGLWLTEELATNLAMLSSLLVKIDMLKSRQSWQYLQPGQEFILTMSQDGVEVRAALLDDIADEAPDELNHYDQESYACCGLDDFRQLLQSWAEFIKASD